MFFSHLIIVFVIVIKRALRRLWPLQKGCCFGFDRESKAGMLFIDGGVGADEGMDAAKKRPFRRRWLGSFQLVFFLQRVNPILALDVGFPRLIAVLTGVNGVSDFLPVLLTEVTSIKS